MVILLTKALEWAAFKHAFMSTVKHLTKKIEALRGKVEEFKETTTKKLDSLSLKVEENTKTCKLIVDDVTEMTSQTSQLVFDLDEELTEIISGIEAKLGSLKSKQDETLSIFRQLCQAVDVQGKTSTKV